MIIQVWISTHFGVISERLPVADEELLCIRGIFTRRRGFAREFERFWAWGRREGCTKRAESCPGPWIARNQRLPKAGWKPALGPFMHTPCGAGLSERPSLTAFRGWLILPGMSTDDHGLFAARGKAEFGYGPAFLLGARVRAGANDLNPATGQT